MSEQNPEREPVAFTAEQMERLGDDDVVVAVAQALASASNEDYDPIVHRRRAEAAVGAVRQHLSPPVLPEAEDGTEDAGDGS